MNLNYAHLKEIAEIVRIVSLVFSFVLLFLGLMFLSVEQYYVSKAFLIASPILLIIAALIYVFQP